MKYYATCFLLSCTFPAVLLSVELSESLRKVGTKATVDKDGSISVHFSVPRPPSGPFGQPVFDPNFKPPPPVMAQHLAEVAKLPKLHALKLSGVPLKASVTDILGVLAEAKELRRLDLTMVRGVTDESLGLIVGLTALEDLSLDNCRKVTNRGLSHVAKLKNIRSVNLVSTQVDDAGLAVLANAKNLETLNLNFTKVRGSGLVHLAGLPKLVSITLNPNRNTADKTQIDLSPLGKGFPSLSILTVGGNRITDAHLASLANLKNLQSVTFRTLGFTQITDVGLAAVANFPKLRELRINGSVKVTDVGVAHLAKLNKLEKLDLGRTRISSASAAVLGKLPALKELEVVGSGFGPDGIVTLRKLNPKVRVTLHRPLN
jgi:Leucine-rich repeat (LRR) protein